MDGEQFEAWFFKKGHIVVGEIFDELYQPVAARARKLNSDSVMAWPKSNSRRSGQTFSS